MPGLGASSRWCVVHLRVFMVSVSRRLQVSTQSDSTPVQTAKPAEGLIHLSESILHCRVGESQTSDNVSPMRAPGL